MADLAFLLLVFVAVAGMFSAARGIALRAPGGDPDAALPAPDTPAIWVKVRADASLLLDGTPVPRALAVQAVRARLAPYPDAVVVLGAEPQAAYGDVAGFVAEILGDGSLPGASSAPRVAIPTRKQLEAYARAVGRDPFEVVR
jgi:biopolymer transport protein ExbD